MSNKTYAAIFDMDGVLINSYDAHFLSFKRWAAEQGRRFSAEDFANVFGRTSREIIHTIWPGEFTDEQIVEADKLKEAYYREIIVENFPEMPAARELLNALHAAGLKLAIGSSGPPENVALVVEKLGAKKLFDARITGFDVTRGKPDPEVFILAAKALGVPSENCVVIEDAVAGVQAAVASGAKCIAITGTAAAEKLTAAGAALVIDTLSELTYQRICEIIEA